MLVKAIVEVEKGSSRRAVLDDHLEITRYRELNISYPFAYGFILNTSSDDGDGIDCYILTNKIIKAGSIVDCVPIGLLEQLENDEMDSKVICLLENDDFKFDQKHVQQIKDFILQIFKRYPEIKIRFGEFKDKSFAINYINERSISKRTPPSLQPLTTLPEQPQTGKDQQKSDDPLERGRADARECSACNPDA